MLEKIRKNTNNLAVKIFLWLIALSFVGIGGASFVGGNDGGDVVVFDKVDSITMQEFYAAKTREIESFQNNINLTDENIKELGIDNAVLSRLIQESMIQYLSNHYDFDISEEFVGDFVKTIPYFKNDKGEFDLVAVGRALLQDPQWANKIHQGNMSALETYSGDALVTLS